MAENRPSFIRGDSGQVYQQIPGRSGSKQKVNFFETPRLDSYRSRNPGEELNKTVDVVPRGKNSGNDVKSMLTGGRFEFAE